MPKTRHNDRRCVGTGAALGVGDLALRFARSPDGILVPDLAEKLPGRGAWLSPSPSALTAALTKGGFARAFRAPAHLPEGMDEAAFAARIGELLQGRALEQLGLARRAGDLVSGSDTVMRSAKRLRAYLYPQDAAPDSVRKIRARLEKPPKTDHMELSIDAAALGQALGDLGIVHLGLIDGRVSDRVMWDIRRWAAWMPSGAEIMGRSA